MTSKNDHPLMLPLIDVVGLVAAAEMALEYLDSPHFPHRSPDGNDRIPVTVALTKALAGLGTRNDDPDQLPLL